MYPQLVYSALRGIVMLHVHFFCYNSTAIWFNISSATLQRIVHILNPWKVPKLQIEVEVTCLLYKRKTYEILEEFLFNVVFAAFWFFVREMKCKESGTDTCLHFRERPSGDNILVDIVFITLTIASFNTTYFPVPVLLQCPPLVTSTCCSHSFLKD